MSFKRAFERNISGELQRAAGSRAPNEEANNTDHTRAPSPKDDEDYYDTTKAQDAELSEKAQKPPRFSTVFTTSSPPPAPTPTPIIYPDNIPRKSGVFLPTPLFILLAALLFLESTALFAYTIIGLYNNRPYGLFNLSSGPSFPSTCTPGVNIIMPQALPTITVTANANDGHVFQTAGTTSPLTTSTSSTTSPSPTSTKVVTFTPKPVVATSNVFVTVAPDGKTLSPSPTSSGK